MSTRTTRPRSASAFSGSEFSQTGARSSAERSLWVRWVMDTWSSYLVLTVLMSPRPGQREDEHEDHDEPAQRHPQSGVESHEVGAAARLRSDVRHDASCSAEPSS